MFALTCTCMLYVSINSNVLHSPPSFLAFHIPLILSLEQLKISEICTVQSIQLQILCILTRRIIQSTTYNQKLPHIYAMTKWMANNHFLQITTTFLLSSFMPESIYLDNSIVNQIAVVWFTCFVCIFQEVNFI